VKQNHEIEVPPPSDKAAVLLSAAAMQGIGAVERDTGLSKDTLRVWERRYAFPNPERDAGGERVYPRDQVEKLRAIKRLMDGGHRPGKLVGCSLDELRRMSQERDNLGAGRGRAQLLAQAEARAAAAAPPIELTPYLDLVRGHRIVELRRALGHEAVRRGLGRFVIEVAAPLCVAIGELWMQGMLEVFEEHLFTESMQVVLRHAIATVPLAPQAPRVLLTTFPNEQHGLGLLMAEAMLTLEGAHCVSLGVETPVWDIVKAAQSQRMDIVALSFSLAYPVAQAVEGLAGMRRSLPADIEIWVGGGSELLSRRLPGGLRSMGNLESVRDEVAAWRDSHRGA
jgi:DNA-binding transcriptional MerR regulator/methylmalonyl-CoA mutase cobalamin-binding subunit